MREKRTIFFFTFKKKVSFSFLRPSTFAGSSAEVHSPESLNLLLPGSVANQAVKNIVDAQEPEDSLTEEDFALAATLEYEIIRFSSFAFLFFSWTEKGRTGAEPARYKFPRCSLMMNMLSS